LKTNPKIRPASRQPWTLGLGIRSFSASTPRRRRSPTRQKEGKKLVAPNKIQGNSSQFKVLFFCSLTTELVLASDFGPWTWGSRRSGLRTPISAFYILHSSFPPSSSPKTEKNRNCWQKTEYALRFGTWNLELGTSLELGTWNLEL
jgi:hypothetical protein